jgi:hypothetical protein
MEEIWGKVECLLENVQGIIVSLLCLFVAGERRK